MKAISQKNNPIYEKFFIPLQKLEQSETQKPVQKWQF
jgi:hypothetical protein